MKTKNHPTTRHWQIILILLVLVGGALRLFDSTDPPLDFQPTRQLRNSLVARSIYYDSLADASARERQLAASFRRSVGLYEPPIIETLVGWTYLATGESFAVARVYQTLLWLLAGLALFDLARRAASLEAGFLALAYYLVLPFSVQASRSFQPDPLMTSLFVGGLYFMWRWAQEMTWKSAVLAGLFFGLAALVKIVIAFMIAGAAISVVLVIGLPRIWRSGQLWVMAALAIVPAFAYYVVGTPGRSTEYFFAWTVTLIELVLTGDFYSKWLALLGSLFGLTMLALAVLGAFLAESRLRAMLVGAWVGYFLYGLTLPFQMYTHSYYHIQLIPLVALGISPIVPPLILTIRTLPRFWRAASLALLLGAASLQAWAARSILAAEDFREEPALWEEIGAAMPVDADVIALTQDYGYRLMYWGWRKVDLWPIATELSEARGGAPDAASDFTDDTSGMEYFLVTAFGQLDRQPGLRNILASLPVAAEGDGYVVYDLRK